MPGSVPEAVDSERAARGPELIEVGRDELTGLRNELTELRAAVAHLRAPGSVPDAAQLAEISQRAVVFAIDYLSWNEDDPQRRAAALAPHLPEDAETNPGWPRPGCQRATYAIAGATKSRGDTTFVLVFVHVTPFERVKTQPAPAVDDEVAAQITRVERPRALPSSAPAPNAEAWAALDSEWIPLQVPVRRLPAGRLVIDLEAKLDQTINHRSE